MSRNGNERHDRRGLTAAERPCFICGKEAGVRLLLAPTRPNHPEKPLLCPRNASLPSASRGSGDDVSHPVTFPVSLSLRI